MFRKIHENDKNLFLELAKEFYASDAVMKSIPLEYHKRTFEEIMRSDAYLMCYIIECDGKNAGFALLNKTYQHEAGGCILWLEEFYVRKEFRSKGLGKDFLHYLDGLLEQDINWIRLEVEPDNERAIRLYESLGYKKLPYMPMVKEREGKN